MYERIIVRLDLAEPGTWVVKGGLALDVRMGSRARTSMDLDLGLRADAIEGDRLRDRISEVLNTDPDDDGCRVAIRTTFEQRGTHEPPSDLGDPPRGWTDDYAALVTDLDIEADSLHTAFNLVRS